MKRLKKHSLLASVFSLFALLNAHAAETFQEIEIQGNNRIERSAVLEKMSLRPGAAITNEAVRRDIQNIFALGFFKAVQPLGVPG